MRSVFGNTRISGFQTSAAAQQEATSAKHSANRVEAELKTVQANLAKTLLICESLWELLAEKTNLTIDDLHQKLYEVDMRDGVLDGKNQRQAVECPNCRHMVSSRHAACLYCGQIIDDSVFNLS